MTKRNIITLAGKLGSGKSSTAKKVAESLDYKHYSTGDFMRSIANNRGISLSELGTIAESDSSIDKELDDNNLEIGKLEKVVLDSRLGFYFIPDSFKVFLDLDPDTAAERILEDKKLNNNRNTESDGSFDTKEIIIENISNRLSSERKRYKELYNINDHTSIDNFDLIINTKKLSIDEVSDLIINAYNNWLNNKNESTK